ncbi:MAG: hypothetical protein H6671_02775 [Anaerolineaceae bacterium]|nr:hypothetical protein [Anaerolineaceae bacterium]
MLRYAATSRFLQQMCSFLWSEKGMGSRRKKSRSGLMGWESLEVGKFEVIFNAAVPLLSIAIGNSWTWEQDDAVQIWGVPARDR